MPRPHLPRPRDRISIDIGVEVGKQLHDAYSSLLLGVCIEASASCASARCLAIS